MSKLNDKVAEIKISYSMKIPMSERVRITKSKDAEVYFRSFWDEDGDLEYVESFRIILMDRSNKALGIKNISKGGLTGTMIDIRIIFQAALKAHASSMILAHNHPSGNNTPSEADIRITKKVVEAGKIMDIQVLDHLILLPEGEYYSMMDNGVM